MKFEKKFYTRFGSGEVTWVMKVEDWAKRRDDWLGRLILTFILPWLVDLWIEIKTGETMADVDKQAKDLVDKWDADDEWMIEPKYTEKKDDQNPLGVSEMRVQAPWLKNSEENHD